MTSEANKLKRFADFERPAAMPRCRIAESLSTLEMIFHLKDFQTRHGADSAVVGQKRGAVTHQRGCHLDSIRRLELEHRTQLSRSFEEATINFDKSQAAAISQQRLIAIGKRRIAG